MTEAPGARKNEWSTLKDEIWYNMWVPSVGPVDLYFICIYYAKNITFMKL
jgi:hypothetical protein